MDDMNRHGTPRRGHGRARLTSAVSGTAAALLALLIAWGCGTDQAAVSEADVSRARQALGPFKSQLMKALTRALAEDPARAIDVCSARAPEIAASLSTEGVRMGRTSHRLRNPGNAPEAWMEPLLQAYVSRPDDREPHAVRIDDRTVGYVEPIHVKRRCLLCHGEDIPAAIAERIDDRYPDDQARGFRAGDFRGMFWVEMKTTQTPVD